MSGLESCTLSLRIQPGAKRTSVAGLYGESIRIALQALPVDGKANDALIRFLAEILQLSRAQVEILSGHSSRSKLIRLQGISLERATEKLLGSRS